MTLLFTPSFIEDLQSADDARLIKRVLSHCSDGSGNFLPERNDHRYEGIENAWIRYVSMSKAAYRIIYIRRGADVYLYRVGPHSVEDNLAPLRSFSGIPLSALQVAERPKGELGQQGDLVKTSDVIMLSTLVRSMIHVPHKEIVLVSPYYSAAVLDPKAPFGRFLDRAVEENTIVHFITKGTDSTDLDFFAGLEKRGVFVYFHPRLHAKMYLFDVNTDQLNVYTRDVQATAIIGSANLTDMGLALAGDGGGNEELCYRLPPQQFSEARDHAAWLINQSADFVRFRARTRKQK